MATNLLIYGARVLYVILTYDLLASKKVHELYVAWNLKSIFFLELLFRNQELTWDKQTDGQTEIQTDRRNTSVL